MLYKCNHCKQIFSEDEVEKNDYKESYEFWGSTVYRRASEWSCPYCGAVEDMDEYYGSRFDDPDDDDLDEEFEDEEDVAMIIAEDF